MSKMISHGDGNDSAKAGSKWALILGVIWLVVVAILWIALRNDEGEGGGFLNFVGRWHVLIVHIPIGLLLVVGAIEVVCRGEKLAHIREAVPGMLWFSFLGAIGATVLGFVLMKREGTAGLAMPLHMWTGFGVVVFSLIALIARNAGKSGAYAFSLLLAIGAVSAAGHYGGTLIHGKEYLTEHAPEPIKNVIEPVMFAGLGGVETEEPGASDANEGETEQVLEEQIAYTTFVAPILESKCNECHNADKIKGKLRMDTHELLMAGAEGSDYPTVEPGDAENSELIVRVTLPADDDDFMPPSGDNEPLTQAEIEILSWWIKGGADKEKTVAALAPDSETLGLLAAFDATRKGAEVEEIIWQPEWQGLPSEEKEARLLAANEAAQKYNFSLMPISAEDDRLRVNVINAAKDFGDEQLKELEPIAEQILWLDVARSQVTNDGMKSVNKMRNLEKLHLEETKITDEGIAQIAPLENLEYLNLYGTNVTNAIFDHLQNMPNLKKLYLWQTKVDPAIAKSFERSVNLEINTGIDLAAAAAAAAPKPAEEKPAEKPKEATKKPAPAPEKKPDAPKADAKAATPKAKAKAKAPAPVKKADQPKAAPKKPAPVKKADTPNAAPAPKPDAAKADKGKAAAKKN